MFTFLGLPHCEHHHFSFRGRRTFQSCSRLIWLTLAFLFMDLFFFICAHFSTGDNKHHLPHEFFFFTLPFYPGKWKMVTLSFFIILLISLLLQFQLKDYTRAHSILWLAFDSVRHIIPVLILRSIFPLTSSAMKNITHLFHLLARRTEEIKYKSVKRLLSLSFL